MWKEITKRDSIQQCMFNSWFECKALAPGNKFRMTTPSRKYAGVVGEIVEVTPLKRYVHTMRFPQFDDPALIVTHEITPVEGGVEYQMTLTNLTPGAKSSKQAAQGMTMIANTLKALVETGRPSFGIRLLYGLFKLMEPLSPAKLKTDNFPL